MVSLARTGVTQYATPNDNEVVVTRVFAAPRRLVFDAYTTPRHLRQWLLGPEGWTMTVCEIEQRPGGAWRYTWRKANGTEMTLWGEVREFVPPERLVMTENWGDEWPESLNTVVFTESNGHTTITLTITYPDKAARDAAMATGMEDGMEVSFARLDQLLSSLV
jgi:uncharacterized protein YndB with AHSA1/START domain